ncbi:MAG: DUF192 domain-containing protein [Candidatus Aenigmarchaeota archaeon]|nr:DUF192 domain-containing protein [Candidatus Aenigmarchaeota archaeon]
MIRKYTSIFAIIVLLVISSCATSKYVEIGNNKIDVIIADAPEKWSKGLQNVASISENSGMLFVFPEPRQANFWMKDTLIPLDMIFIDENKVIQFIRKNVQPCTQEPCKTYSHDNIKYVLEVNAGYADKKKIKTGDKLMLSQI